MYVWRDMIVEVEALVACMIWRCCLVDEWLDVRSHVWARKWEVAKIISLIH
jgi:hypothetical protein